MINLEFLLRYGMLLVGLIILLRATYFRITPNRETYLGFFLFGHGVFLVTYLLHNIEMSMGFAFGLFAVFAMLRYRTEPISIRDMTYLFVVILMSLICSVANLSFPELCFVLVLICGLAAFSETAIFAPRIMEKKIVYDNVEFISPSRNQELIADISSRTGLNVIKAEVGKIDYLNDSAQIIIFYSGANDEN